MEFRNLEAVVYGAGKSGAAASALLSSLGAHVTLFDGKADPEAVREKLSGLAGSVRIVTGTLPDEVYARTDLLVLSPGVPTDLPDVIRFREAGIPVWGEVELAFRAGRGRVLAVTGTNGKTTTTALLGAIMGAVSPEVFVVGNIGNAWTGEALKTTERSTVVAEISSFQLETIHEFRPSVSAILNITEDHLNRHHTMEEYIRVKELITKNQDGNDTCVLNYEDPVLREFAASCPTRVFFFSSARELDDGIFLRDGEIVIRRDGAERKLLLTDELKLIGVHNYENVMAAAAMAYAAGVEPGTIAEVCRAFRPVAHRIEYIAEKNGVIWYNDSKGTNPDAAIRGIRAMSRPTFLIAGGYDKGSDYDEWIRSFDGRVKRLVLEGKTAENIRESALRCGFPGDRIVMKETMREAMDYCRAHAEAGDAVLLSPACASWGEFPNYEVRGETFRDYVEKEIPG
ncbi:MAG: UDP-N-acetylmuramoyl-L-alanine--D-glutamate ligase [Lachnospiraceae bacterium]|nr:UDP-N-acetylmuramoyl-L-alanine--D-glutamate ligase [Lachnospiraceae bacterium]